MIQTIARIGTAAINTCQKMGESSIFLVSVLFQRPRFGQLWRLGLDQIYRVGVLSLIIILLSALFIGMVVALQGFTILNKFGATAELGQMIALTVLRELGPVITALLFVGRACSSLTAEIGLMRATQQLDCMDMMAVDPLWRVIAPRFWAGIISLPLLTILFNVTAIYGGVLVGVEWLGVDNGAFWSNMQSAVNFHQDVLNGVIKSIVFAIVVVWIAVYQGFYAEPNSLGISRATTKTVVYSSLMILALDFVLTALMMGGW
jgi:phospholipid/cholesterol/gamma-HCH transport system permease protein